MSKKYLMELTPEGGWIDRGQPKLTPLEDHELSLPKRTLVKTMLQVGKARCPNIFRTMFRNFRVYFPFALFNAKVMPKGELPRRDTELAILRVGWKTRSYYEWGQHVDVGLRVGLTPEEIYRVTLSPDAEGWTEYESAVVRAVDELVDDKSVSDETWNTLSNHLEEKLLIELLFAITTYNSLACMLNSIGVELEDDVEQILKETTY